jgi:hypothetical protein
MPLGSDAPFGIATEAQRRALYVAPSEHILSVL